jgi:hypothetical protein
MPRGAAEVAQKLQRMARNLRDNLKRAEADTTDEALRIARAYSRGQLDSADLRRLGHPYRKGGNPPADPAMINRRSGAFASGWRSTPPRESAAGDLMSRLSNVAPKAGYIFGAGGGKSRMMARPILARVAQLLERRRQRRLTEKLQQTLKF